MDSKVGKRTTSPRRKTSVKRETPRTPLRLRSGQAPRPSTQSLTPVKRGTEVPPQELQLQNVPEPQSKESTKPDEVWEDRASTIVILAMCLFFALYLGYQFVASRMGKGGISNTPNSSSGIPFTLVKYKCAQHNGDVDACVKAQTSGKGCSWYSDCQKCIVGGHEGRSFEDICGKPRP